MPIDLSSSPDVLDEQRKRSDSLARLLGVAVHTFESDHFIVHTTLPESLGRDVPAFAEAAYGRFLSDLKLKSADLTFSGKVVLYALAKRDEFSQFSVKAHGRPAGSGSAYFRAAGDQAELVLPAAGDMTAFRQDLTHETAHLLLHFYYKPGGVPNWVQEGLAQWFEFRAFPDCRACSDSRALVGKDPAASSTLAAVLKDDRPRASSDLAGYACAWSFVSYLLEKNPSGFVSFVISLKAGVSQDAAAEKAFADNLGGLGKAWSAAVHTDK